LTPIARWPDAHLAGRGRRRLAVFRLQHVGAAVVATTARREAIGRAVGSGLPPLSRRSPPSRR
jgi:hypothetical protein